MLTLKDERCYCKLFILLNRGFRDLQSQCRAINQNVPSAQGHRLSLIREPDVCFKFATQLHDIAGATRSALLATDNDYQ